LTGRQRVFNRTEAAVVRWKLGNRERTRRYRRTGEYVSVRRQPLLGRSFLDAVKINAAAQAKQPVGLGKRFAGRGVGALFEALLFLDPQVNLIGHGGFAGEQDHVDFVEALSR